MSRLYRLAPLLLLASSLAIAQDAGDPATIPADRPVLVCTYLDNGKAFKPDVVLNCYTDGRFTLTQLYKAGWRVAHYAVYVEGVPYHELILERRQ